MKLNETPVRTCRNYNINNIKLENVKLLEKKEKFQNVEIIGTNDIEHKVNKTKLKYGIGEKLENEVNEKSNHSLKLELEKKSNIQIKYEFDEKNLRLIDNIEIIAKKEAKANVLIKYKANEDLEYYHNGIIKLKAEEKAQIDIVIVNLLNTKSNHFLSIENELEENSNINYTIIDFGGKHSITNYYSNLQRKISKKHN